MLLGVGCALGFLVGAGITAMVVVSRCKPKTGRHHGTILASGCQLNMSFTEFIKSLSVCLLINPYNLRCHFLGFKPLIFEELCDQFLR